MSFPDVFMTALYVAVSLLVIGAALYGLTLVVLLAALGLQKLWYRVRRGRKKR